jgi:hypothetical protein
MRVNAEGRKGGETTYCGCVRCTFAAYDNGKDVDLGTMPVLSNGIGEGVYLSWMSCAVWERLRSVHYFHSLSESFLMKSSADGRSYARRI